MTSVRAATILTAAITAIALAVGYGQAALDQASAIGDYNLQEIVTGQEPAPSLPEFDAPFGR